MSLRLNLCELSVVQDSDVDAIDRFCRLNLLVVGDLMLDEYVQGTVSRMSPESPVPLLLRDPPPADRMVLERLGGAGNTARNVASFGASVTLVSALGRDRAGDMLLALAEDHRPDTDGQGLKISCRFAVEANRTTTHKLRLVNRKGVQLFRIDGEAFLELSDETRGKLLVAIGEEIPRADAIIVSDYAKGVVTDELFTAIRALAGSKPIIVDPKEREPGERLKRYGGAHSIIPNESELIRSFAGTKDIGALLEKDGRDVMDTHQVQALICTRGEAGVMFATRGAPGHQTIRGPKVEVADVTGASDTFTATYALAFCATGDVARSIRLAEAASRGKVMKPMTGTITTSELKMIVDPPSRRRAISKICARDAFIERCRQARAGGDPIAFITGCFDILHRGHLAILERALEVGGFTAIAINSDAYVTRRKRPGGPYLDQDARALLVGSMSMVDAVCVFDEDEPTALIETIAPDVLIMGEEYRDHGDNLAGKMFVEAAGGRIIFVPEVDGYRSSRIAEGIRART